MFEIESKSPDEITIITKIIVAIEPTTHQVYSINKYKLSATIPKFLASFKKLNINNLGVKVSLITSHTISSSFSAIKIKICNTITPTIEGKIR